MKIFISGQITGLELSTAQTVFNRAEAFLIEEGYRAVNPMKVTPYNPLWEWEHYMINGIKELMECEAIYLLTGWHNSKGARIEHNIAKEMGFKIIYE